MSRIEVRLRFVDELPDRAACPLCGLAAMRCDLEPDERAFVCDACCAEVVAIVLRPAPQVIPRSRRAAAVRV